MSYEWSLRKKNLCTKKETRKKREKELNKNSAQSFYAHSPLPPLRQKCIKNFATVILKSSLSNFLPESTNFDYWRGEEEGSLQKSHLKYNVICDKKIKLI